MEVWGARTAEGSSPGGFEGAWDDGIESTNLTAEQTAVRSNWTSCWRDRSARTYPVEGGMADGAPGTSPIRWSRG